MFEQFDFTQFEGKETDIVEVHSLKSVATKLGLSSVALANQGKGNFAILKKHDGTSTTMRASKLLEPKHLDHARVARLKQLDDQGKQIWILVRPEGESTIVKGVVHF